MQIPQTCTARHIRAVDRDVTDDDAVASVTLETPVPFSCFDTEKTYSKYAQDDLAQARGAYWKLSTGCFMCGCETGSEPHVCNGWVRVHCAGDDGEEHEALAYAELRTVRLNERPARFLPRLYLKLAGKCTLLEWALNMLEILRAARAAGVLADAEIQPLPLLSQLDAHDGMHVSVFAMEDIPSHYASAAPPSVLREIMLHASRIALQHGPVVCLLPRKESAKDVMSFWKRLHATRVPVCGVRLSDDAAKLNLHKLLSANTGEAERGELCEKIKRIIAGTEQRPPPELDTPHFVSFFRAMRSALDEQRRQWAFSREHLSTGALHGHSLAADLAFLRATSVLLGRNVLYSTEIVMAKA